MSLHSTSGILVHIIWETLNREKFFNEESGRAVSAFLYKYAKEKGIWLEANYVNPEHVHALYDQGTNITTEDCAKLFKGASSHYVNHERIVPVKFNWGRGFAAFSVSESRADCVVRYIKNQKEHYRKKSFNEELELFLSKYKIKKKQ
jgi:putative transposase